MNLAARASQVLSFASRRHAAHYASCSYAGASASVSSRTYHSGSWASTSSSGQCRVSAGVRMKSRFLGCSKRDMHASAALQHGHLTRPAPGTGIKVHWKDSKGNLLKTIEGNEGDDLLSLAHEHDIDLEGACEGSVACSTCHVVISPEHYDLIPEPEDDENDMLDMAFGLTDTSRLGCQVKLTKDMDGMTATLPSATRNMFVDGKKPTHH